MQALAEKFEMALVREQIFFTSCHAQQVCFVDSQGGVLGGSESIRFEATIRLLNDPPGFLCQTIFYGHIRNPQIVPEGMI